MNKAHRFRPAKLKSERYKGYTINFQKITDTWRKDFDFVIHATVEIRGQQYDVQAPTKEIAFNDIKYFIDEMTRTKS